MSKKEITEGGFVVGKSDSFQRGIYPNLSRTIDTNGQNGVYVARGGMEEIKLQQVDTMQGGVWDKITEQHRRVYSDNGLSPTIHTCAGGNTEPKVKIIDDTQGFDGIRVYEENAPTLRSERSGLKVELTKHTNSIIRKLTPRECWRLMGFADVDFDRAKDGGMSNSQLYKQAGNSIVVNVLEAIFGQMIYRGGEYSD